MGRALVSYGPVGEVWQGKDFLFLGRRLSVVSSALARCDVMWNGLVGGMAVYGWVRRLYGWVQ